MASASLPLIALVSFLHLAGCTFDPPPGIASSDPAPSTSTTPEANIDIVFTEAIDITSMEMAIWHRSDRLLDPDGQLVAQCRGDDDTSSCSRMWFGPVAPASAVLTFTETPCVCRAEQSFKGNKLIVEQDCRAFKAYETWSCRRYMVGDNELCRELSGDDDGVCRRRMEAAGADWSVEEAPAEDIEAKLSVDPAADMGIGEYLLRFSPGLADLNGNETRIYLDLFFGVTPAGEEKPTSFESGVFVTWLDLSEPFAYPLEVYWIIEVDPDTGVFSGSACDADTIDPSTPHTDYELPKWHPWPYTYDEGYNFAFTGLVQDIEIDGKAGYNLKTDPFRLYAGPPIEVEVIDGGIDVNIFFNETLGRDEMTGFFHSPETYILGSKAGGGRPDIADGVTYGYRLTEDEVKAYEETRAAAWGVCLTPDEDARP